MAKWLPKIGAITMWLGRLGAKIGEMWRNEPNLPIQNTRFSAQTLEYLVKTRTSQGKSSHQIHVKI